MNINDMVMWAAGIFVIGLLGYTFYLLALKMRQLFDIKSKPKQSAQDLVKEVNDGN